MSGPSLLEPQFSRRDSDAAWMHWKRCALKECGEPVDPDESMNRHGELIHTGCAEAFCADSDCEGHDDDEDC